MQECRNDGRGGVVQDGRLRIDPALCHGVGDRHFAGHPAQQRGSQRDDDRDAVHQGKKQAARENHQWNGDGQADDQQHRAAFGGGGHGNHVVHAHHQIGQQDRPDG